MFKENLIFKEKKKRAMRETWLSKERKREQWGRLDYQRQEKESNEGDLIIKGKKKRAMREIWLSKHMHSLSLSSAHTHHPAEREGAQKTSFHNKILKKLTLPFFKFFWWYLRELVILNHIKFFMLYEKWPIFQIIPVMAGVNFLFKSSLPKEREIFLSLSLSFSLRSLFSKHCKFCLIMGC